MTTNEVVLITGVSRGLGREIALLFGRQGYKVIVNYYKSKDKAEEVVKEIGEDHALVLQADVRDKNQVDSMVEKLTWNHYKEQFEGSIKSSLNTVQVVLPTMKKENYGRIINIGTNLFQNPVVTYHEHTTSKAALLGFTRNMAKELGAYSITVNMVSGGILKKTDASSETSDEVFQSIAEESALKRVTAPEDVAEVVAFLGSEASRAVTGQNIVVDSGFTMN